MDSGGPSPTPSPAPATPVVVILLAWMVLGGAYQRLVVYPLVFLWPKRRAVLTSAYFRGMSHGILFCMRLGGATLRRSGGCPPPHPC
jgi:hypothetical protein